MHAAKVEVALWGHIGYVDGDAAGLAQLPYSSGCFRIIHGGQNHVGAIEVGRLEKAVDVLHLFLADTVGDLGVEARCGCNDGHGSIGVETGQDSTGSNLGYIG